ncbi:MAG: outer membrane protein assembly factor BamA [Mariprofundales bacterium]
MRHSFVMFGLSIIPIHKCFFLFIACLSFLIPTLIIAASSSSGIVSEISVRGNRVVEDESVLSHTASQVGQAVNRKQIGKDVRKLFATGFFADVQVLGEAAKDGGINLVYLVKENPIVVDLIIDDNDEIPDKKLLPKLKLAPGGMFSQANLARDSRYIRSQYLKKGYYQVDVQAVATPLEDGRVNVVLTVIEGDITRIRDIRLVGNTTFDDETLRDVVATRPFSASSWFSDRDVYDKKRIGADAQLLQKHYMDRGFLDARIESTWIALSSEKQWFYLTFNIYEGIRYRVSKINIQGDKVPDEDTLLEKVLLETGEWYSYQKMADSLERITERVGDEGFAFASVTPLFTRDPDNQKVAVTFAVEKGREVYIERIEISGNTKTHDAVIRREFRVDEGERYSASRLNRSKVRLNRLGYFDDVRIAMPRGEHADRVKLDVHLEEKNTGSLNVGAGYSQLQKVSFTAKVSENNLFGKGLSGSLSADIGAATQNFSVSVTDPYFLNEEFSASVNASKSQTSLQSYTAYKQDSNGAGISFGIPISEHASYSIGYQYTNSRLYDFPINSSPFLLSQAGTQTTGELSQGISWDNRDSTISATTGSLLQANLGYAGLGGINRFTEMQLIGRSYFDLGNDFILNPSITGRYIKGLQGRDVPLYRRYSLGGASSIRGFDYYGISIRDALGNPLGGDKMVVTTLNLFMPLPYAEGKGFRGVLFADAGMLADTGMPLQTGGMRSSWGYAIQWLSPVGPIGLIWGFPIRKQVGDITRGFEFTIGARF